MKKTFMIILLLTALFNGAEAQLKKIWKRQIYGGYNHIAKNENNPGFDIFDMKYVTKNDFLFNAGFTKTNYKAEVQQPTGSFGIQKFLVSVKQINLSAGYRMYVSPKWSFAFYAGPSYTRVKFPVGSTNHHFKYGVNYYPVTVSVPLSVSSATYDTKSGLGIHLNGEINFFLCENIMLQVGYMFDTNKIHKTEGFTFGGRIGLMKQKSGTRSISRINL